MSEITPAQLSMLHFRALTKSDEEAIALFAETRPTWERYRKYLRTCLDAEREKKSRTPLRWRYAGINLALLLKPNESLLLMPEGRLTIQGITAKTPRPKINSLFRTRANGIAEKVTINQVFADEHNCMLDTSPPLQAGDTLDWGELEGLKVLKSEPKIRKDLLHDGKDNPVSLKRIFRKKGRLYWIIEGSTAPAQLFTGTTRLNFQSVDVLDFIRESRAELIDESGQAFRLEETGATARGDSEPVSATLKTSEGLFSFTFKPLHQQNESVGAPTQGNTIALELPEGSEDSTIDPRDIFMEEATEEIAFLIDAAAPNASQPNVKKFRITHKYEGTYLLEVSGNLPKPHNSFIIPTDRSADYRKQHRAIHQLCYFPLVPQAPLVRLAGNSKRPWDKPADHQEPQWFRWPENQPDSKGTERQKEFVRKALNTPDFCLLEGPPGSGKTHAICELIEQLLKRPRDGRRKRVLVCGSTYASIDNVIDRLKSDPEISLLKVNADGGRHDELRLPNLNQGVRRSLGLGDSDHDRKLANQIVAESADVTCATVMGVNWHPWFHHSPNAEEPVTNNPPWDYLIIDESSKTLVQEFLVPAMMAKRWVIVGDSKQLSPYVDDNALTTNLRGMMPLDQQTALNFCIELISRSQGLKSGAERRPMVARNSKAVNRQILYELKARNALRATIWVGKLSPELPNFHNVSFLPDQLFEEESHRELIRLWMTGAELILVDDDAWKAARPNIPPNAIHLYGHPSPKDEEAACQQARQRRLLESIWPDTDSSPAELFSQTQAKGLANELSWRLIRIHNLGNSPKTEELNRQVYGRLPQSNHWIFQKELLQLSDAALPSILECMQKGMPALKGITREHTSMLTEGLPLSVKRPRMATLDHQHRMHPFISKLPRDIFYLGRELIDSDTVTSPERQERWKFRLRTGSLQRRQWIDLVGTFGGGYSEDPQIQIETEVAIGILRQFKEWAAENPKPPNTKGAHEPWEVACLNFYIKPYNVLKASLGSIYGTPKKGLFTSANVEVSVATVDRFQGHEADLVILMMRRNRSQGPSVGFLDIPNRVNVAITRAREQLVILGDKRFFLNSEVNHLQKLSENS